MVYHVIMFVSLIAAIKLFPWFFEYFGPYIVNELGRTVASYLAVYLSALFVLPEAGCFLYRTLSED